MLIRLLIKDNKINQDNKIINKIVNNLCFINNNLRDYSHFKMDLI